MPNFFSKMINSISASPMAPAEDAVKSLTIQGFGINQEYFGADLTPMFHPNAVAQVMEIGDPWTNSAVAACVGWMSRTLPEAPLVVNKTASTGSVPIANHPLTRLWARPNQYFSGELLLSGILLSLSVAGNAYVHIVKSGAGVPVGLDYLPHYAVKPVGGNGRLIDHYEYTQGNQKIDLPEADVLHLRVGIDPRNLALGLSPLASAIREIATDNEATMYAWSMLKNMGMPGVVISPSDPSTVIEPSDAELIKQKWREKVTGGNRGEPLVLPTPLTLDTFGASPSDMLADSLHDLPESRICALLGVPAMVVGLSVGSDTKTYANYEESRAAAWQECLLPLARTISTQINLQLLPLLGDPATETVDFDTSQVAALQDDLDAAATRMSTLWDAGLVTLGEARAPFGFKATPNDDKFKSDLQPAPVAPAPAPPVPTLPAPPAA